MSDFQDDAPPTDEERLEGRRERFTRRHDDVFLPDGSLVEPMSVLDDPTGEPSPR